MPFENRSLIFLGCAFLTVTCFLYIIADILPMWGKYTSRNSLVTFGLWGFCEWRSGAPDDYQWECEDGTGYALKWYTKMVVARLFLTIASILSSLSVLAVVSILLIDENSKRNMAMLTKVLSIATLVTGVIGLSLGINFVVTMLDDDTDPTETLHIYTASILAIAAVVLNLFSSIITFFIK